MLICLEGVDGAGKSTLAAAIKKLILDEHPTDEVDYLHATQISGSIYEEYVDPLDIYTPGSGRHLILDRWHIGEEIYGPLYRGGSKFTKSEFTWVDLYMGSLGARLWNVTQDIEVIEERLAARGEDYLQSHHVDRVRREFLTVSRKSSIFANDVSPNMDNVYDIAEFIIDDAKYAEIRAAGVDPAVHFIGNAFVDPKALVILDNKADNVFFCPANSVEATNFLSHLDNTTASEIAFVSSSTTKLKKLINRFESSGILVYADSVAKRLDKAEIPYVKIPIPTADKSFATEVRIAVTDSVRIEGAIPGLEEMIIEAG